MNNHLSKAAKRPVRYCANCICSNLGQSSLVVRLLGLCPILAVTTSVLKAFTIAMLLLMVGVLSTIIGTLLRSMVIWQLKPLYFAVLASVSTLLVVNLVGIYLPLLVDSLGVYVLLIAANCQIISQLQELAEHDSLSLTLPRVVKDGCWILVLAIAIAVIREFASHGVLFHDWSLVYGLPPIVNLLGPLPFLAEAGGALIAFGMLLGLVNFYSQRQPESSSANKAKGRRLLDTGGTDTHG